MTTTWADAHFGIRVIPAAVPIVAVVAVSPDLNIDALGHLDALGLAGVTSGTVVSTAADAAAGKSDVEASPGLI
jgi:hypothetical protein